MILTLYLIFISLLDPCTEPKWLSLWLAAPSNGVLRHICLDLEAPPPDQSCSSPACTCEGIYWCTDCFLQPLFCTSCYWEQHVKHPLHQAKQWVDQFFDDSSLCLVSIILELSRQYIDTVQAVMEIQLSHGEHWCLVSATAGDPLEIDEDSWEDIEFTYCNCTGAAEKHIQLFWSQLFLASLLKPQTAFTFWVLDDFLWDNVECGTLAMNYFSKLRWITSNAFPHLVPVSSMLYLWCMTVHSDMLKDHYRELMRVARQWWLLKTLKWNGYGVSSNDPGQGGLVLFCPACPQPGINVPVTPDTDFSHWRYTHIVVMDGNFKVEHMHSWKSEDDV